MADVVAAVRALYRHRFGPGDYRLTDGWRFPSIGPDGRYKGDCDRFVFALFAEVYGGRGRALRALLFGAARVWHCKHFGVGHAVGEIDGVAFDNSGTALPLGVFQERPGYSRWSRRSRLMVALKLLRGLAS